MIRDLISKATCNDTIIRVYKNECRLNESASKLLGLTDDMCVKFVFDDDKRAHGGERVFVRACDSNTPKSFFVTRRCNEYRIYSSTLSRTLSEYLDGYGTYRICPEETADINGSTYYEIFRKRFE